MEQMPFLTALRLRFVYAAFAACAIILCVFLVSGPPRGPFPGLPRGSQLDDEFFLGPQSGDALPKRLAGFSYHTAEYQEMYDKAWLQGGYPKQSCWGCRFGGDVAAKLKFHSVLDAGKL